MRIALLISGYLRTFEENIKSIKEKIISHHDEVDIYLHITKNEEIVDKYYNPDIQNFYHIIEKLDPKFVIFEENVEYTKDKKKNDTYNLWAKFHKLNKVKCLEEESKGIYDLVIKYRPDINLNSKIICHDISPNTIYIPRKTLIDRSKLKNKDDKYICDIISYGDSHIMDRYFGIYEVIEELFEKYGYVSETLLFNYLNDGNIPYKLIDIDFSVTLSKCNIFAITGDSGSGKTTLGNKLKTYFSNSFMLECDRYHKWERLDQKWLDFTHLNPEANYLTKMSEDIFNLKTGNSVLQVDYDHNTGKFTEPEIIESSDNIIVCGLHPLYNDNSLYNLSIYMDTNEDLKKKWKISRDVSKRGYTEEKVLKQIEYRKEDYYKFIYPQREISDIIINFHTNGDLGINDNNLSLRVFVKEKFNVMGILSVFQDIKLDFEYTNTKEYHILFFKEYQDVSIPINVLYSNYYDYIIYIILNIKKKN